MKNNFLGLNINKLKRIGILFLTILVLGWAWHYLTMYRPWDIRIPTIKVSGKVPDYAFHSITVSEVSGENTFYKLSSNGLTLDREQGVFNGISGNIMSGKTPSFYFEARTGLLNFLTQEVLLKVFYGRTIANGNQKGVWQVSGPTAVWNKRQQTMTIDKEPVLKNKNITIKSAKFVYYIPLSFFMIGPNCDITSGEYHISCQKASLKEKVEMLTLEDNVVFESKTLNGRSDLLDINYSTADYVLKNNVILDYSDSGLNADYVSFNAQAKDTVALKGNVKFSYKKDKQNITAQSDAALLDRKNNLLYFYENTKATKNDSYIESNQLVFDYKLKEFNAAGGGRTKIIKSSND